MIRAVPWAFVSLFCLACPKRVDFGPEGPITDAKSLLQLVDKAEAKIISIHGDAKIRADSPENHGVISLFVSVMHPSFLHLESLDFFGKPQGVLVSNGVSFSLYQAQEGRFYRGPASAQNISRFVPLSLPPEELAAIMLGRVPRIPAEEMDLGYDADAKAYQLRLRKGSIQQTLWIHPSHYRVVKSEVCGIDAYDLSFEDIQTTNSIPYPRRVILRTLANGIDSAQPKRSRGATFSSSDSCSKVASAQSTFELLYKDVELNGEVDLTIFELEVPANVPVVEVDGAGNLKDSESKEPLR